MNYELAIIILNYKTPKLVQDCLTSLDQQINKSSTKIIIVDNYSSDDSVETINDFIKDRGWCELIASSQNLGFAGGNNLGIRNVNAKYYLLLNSDTIAKANAIKNLLEYAKSNENLGIISCHLEGPKGEKQTQKFRFHTPFSEFLHQANIGILFKIFKKWQVPIFDNENDDADWVCFAAVLIRKEVFQKIGFLDDGYFMYYEDVDFCKRARKAQISVGVCKNAIIIHLISASSKIDAKNDSKLKRRPAYYYKSRSRYYGKYYKTIFIANVCWTAGRLISLLVQPFRHRQERHDKDYLDIWTLN